MIDYVNQFLFLYMVPFIISYLCLRRQFKKRQPTGWDVALVVIPGINWFVVFYFLLEYGGELLIEIVGFLLDWTEDRFTKSNVVKRFFRIKDKE